MTTLGAFFFILHLQETCFFFFFYFIKIINSVFAGNYFHFFCS